MNIANIKKTIRYCKKNGLLQAVYAVCERLQERKEKPYEWQPIPQELLEKQKNKCWNYNYKISIVVPTFETNKKFLIAMINSVLEQTYTNLELIIVDASTSLSVETVVLNYQDTRIKFQKLDKNLSISENTNQGIVLATGDYIGLLDHDDMLTPNALYEIVLAIEEKKTEGKHAILVYSDEDKTNESATAFFEPHYKEDFNLDLLLSNNYICHFAVIASEVIKALEFRKEYDGAQDYDMILRTIAEAKEDQNRILHVNKILYHWRCHSESTAANPASKMYAYESGKRAIGNYISKKGWQGTVEHTKHLGFYKISYPSFIWKERSNVAAVGGPVITGNKIISGAMNKEGDALYKGLAKQYSGYMKKAMLQQQVEVLDIRNMKVNPQCEKKLASVLKLFEIDEPSNKGETKNYRQASIEFAKRVSEKGYILIYDPTE